MKNMLDDLLKEIHPEPFERRIKLLVVPTVMRNRQARYSEIEDGKLKMEDNNSYFIILSAG